MNSCAAGLSIAVFQRENSNGAADDGQLHRQLPDEWMFGGERQDGLRLAGYATLIGSAGHTGSQPLN
jgi:hypothetical protein